MEWYLQFGFGTEKKGQFLTLVSIAEETEMNEDCCQALTFKKEHTIPRE